jgi:hypothetical protein
MQQLLRWPAVLVFLSIFSPATPALILDRFDPGELDFSVEAKGVEFNYRLFSLFSLPGERIELNSEASLTLKAEAGRSGKTPNGWAWTAPQEVGRYVLTLSANGATMRLNIFVLRPASEVEDGKLGDYRIGAYAEKPFRGLPTYEAPKGFIEVTPAMHGIRVAPHFTLGQFLCKQEADGLEYLVLRPELLLKLERSLARVNAAGIRADSFEIMSGFRTPWYNRAIGNRTTSSRHLYGGAADIFIDVAPRDGVMDDLNGDGRVDKADADFLYDLFDGWSASFTNWQKLIGGLGAYKANAVRGPFVHLDARGYRARWGR